MKIIFKKEDFLNSLNIVSKALKKSNFQILECILIDASKSNIVLVCQDGKEITIKRETEGTIVEKGKAAIEGQRLISIIRSMPENQDVESNVNDKKECVIKCGSSIKMEIQTFDETTYPNIMSVNKENKVIINEYKLKRLIEKTSFSYDKNQNIDNVVLKGIYLKVNKENIEAKSMNSHTLSIIKDTLVKDFGKFDKIVPGSSLEEVNKLIKGDVDKDVNIYFNDKNIAFEFNNTLFTSIIIPNSYIDTDKIVSVEYSTKITVNRSDLIESLVRTTNFTDEVDKKPVVFDIKENEMDVTLSSLRGETFEKLSIKKTGKDLTIAFNPNSIIDILNVISDEEVTLYFSGSKQPLIIKDKQETYTYLLTAVNI